MSDTDRAQPRLLRYLTLSPLVVGAPFLIATLILRGFTQEASRAVLGLVFVTSLTTAFALLLGLMIWRMERMDSWEATVLREPLTVVGLVLMPGGEAGLAVIVVLAIIFPEMKDNQPSAISAIAFSMLFPVGGVNLLMYRRSQRRAARFGLTKRP